MTKEPRIYTGERKVSSIVMGKLNSCRQNNETGLLTYAIHKISSKWIKDMNIRPGTTKLVEENIGSKLLDTGLGSDFLNLTVKVRATKSKINRLDYIKLKIILFCCLCQLMIFCNDMV